MSSFGALWQVFWRWIEARPLRRVSGVFAGLLLLVYAGMPAEELTFDNSIIVGKDPRLAAFSMKSLSLIWQHDYWWPSIASNLYRPLTTMSFWLERSFLGYGDNPLGYQLANVALHFLNVVLIWVLARRLGLPRAAGFGAALVFGIHPIAPEAVANIVGRSDLLALTATLGGLIFYFDALQARCSSERRGRFAACGTCALIGVMCKESAVVIPALVGLHGLLRVGELKSPETARVWWRDAVAAVLVMLPAVLFFLFGRLVIGAAPGVSDHPFIDNPLIAEDWLHSRAGALAVWGMQLHALFLPFGLSSDYSFNAIPVPHFVPFNETAWWALGTGVVAVACVIVFRRWCRGTAPVGYLLLAYVVAMLPTSNLLILIGSIRADRFHYLPSAFLWLALAALAERAVRRWRSRLPARQISAMGWMSAAWLLSLLCLAHLRCHDWRTNLTLWQSAATNAPGSLKTMAAVANETVRLSNTPESVRMALDRLRPIPAIYERFGVPGADRSLAIYSDFGAFSTTLFDELDKEPARKEEAKQVLDEGLAWLERGVEYEEAFRQRWAARWNKGSLENGPSFGLLRKNYLVALGRAGRWSEANAMVDEMLSKDPFNLEFIEVKGEILRRTGHPKDAVVEWILLLVMTPDRTEIISPVADLIHEIHPESSPRILTEKGRPALDLKDRFVQDYLHIACRRYLRMLEKEGDLYRVRRLMRTTRLVYGFDLAEAQGRTS